MPLHNSKTGFFKLCCECLPKSFLPIKWHNYAMQLTQHFVATTEDMLVLIFKVLGN